MTWKKNWKLLSKPILLWVIFFFGVYKELSKDRRGTSDSEGAVFPR